MTMRELFSLILRRWYVYVVALLVVGVAIFSLNSSPRIYSATAELEFHAPGKRPPSLEEEDLENTLIDFTGAVVRKYDADFPNSSLSSPNATLFGNGIREGVAVEVAATGNQWVISFVRPVAVIQVASTKSADVLPTIERVAAELDATARSLQGEAGADERYYMTSAIDLDLVTVYSFGQTRTGRYLGTGTLIGVALLLATLAARGIERYLLLRRALASSAAEPRTGASAAGTAEPVRT